MEEVPEWVYAFYKCKPVNKQFIEHTTLEHSLGFPLAHLKKLQGKPVYAVRDVVQSFGKIHYLVSTYGDDEALVFPRFGEMSL